MRPRLCLPLRHNLLTLGSNLAILLLACLVVADVAVDKEDGKEDEVEVRQAAA